MGKIKMLFKNVYVLIFMFVFASTFIFLIILNKKAMPAIMNYASVQTKRVGVEEGKHLPDELYYDVMDKSMRKGIIYEIPSGVVFNNAFLSNVGPKVPVKIKYSGNVGLDVKTRVEKYGINSALVEVYIYVEVTQRTILPFQSKDIKLTSEIPVVMKVIKGNAPYYLSGTNGSYNLPIN